MCKLLKKMSLFIMFVRAGVLFQDAFFPESILKLAIFD